ncbi:WD-40 repeat protein [Reticulomyxa filosa]|uniref:WD-40 repeat protein n=1 Tax=Reticulomyxa filosa TaxID=46433 RepID=X6MR21_RETFI|nr:WD-40 repeat protein [Reticulomyxa filosa]|eukprot:ETO15550.1 WD-40 repeat protein [Reticulomyxa filosa]
MFEVFRSSSKLLKTFTGHTDWVNSIDYLTFDGGQFICSGSSDNTICVWDIETKQPIRSFSGHSDNVYCVKFSRYHYNNNRGVVSSSSDDKTIRFWDIKDSKQFQAFGGHTDGVCGIEFSSFNGGRYLCSGSFDRTIHIWDVETSKSLHVLMNIQALNNEKSNSIGVIGGNGYTICSGSWDKTIRIWDIETTKKLTLFKGHEHWIMSVKYGSNELGMGCDANTILSGSFDKSVRLWDIRSGQQIQMFSGHTDYVRAIEYSPFVVKNIEVDINSNVICSGSMDNTIRFWDIRSNKNELHKIKGDGIICLKFIQLKKNRKSDNDCGCGINLCCGSKDGPIHIWG